MRQALQSMTLAHRNIVAANRVPIPKLVNPNQVCKHSLKRGSVALEILLIPNFWHQNSLTPC